MTPRALACWLIMTSALAGGNATAQQQDVITADQPRYAILRPFVDGTAPRLPRHHIGIDTVQTPDGHVVNSILHGYPAQSAGLRRGDQVLTINGQPYADAWHRQTSDMPAPAPQAWTLVLDRAGQHLTVNVDTVYENPYESRNSASLASVQSFSAGNKTIAYYHPWNLSRNLNDLLAFLQVMRSVALSDGLILDLRDSYGYLSIQHLDAFIPSRRTVFMVTGEGNVHTRFNPREPSLTARHYGKPVAILINAGTGGGAELLAYQLARLDRITTVGEASAGELGEFVSHEGRLEYRPPVATFIDGAPLSTLRVQPELVAPWPLAPPTRSDPQFEAAFNVLLGRI